MPRRSERGFNDVRIAWSSDLGGLPVEPEVRRIIDAQRGVFEDLGCRVEEATPDLADAEEVFRVFRAWDFELSLGELLPRHRSQMKDTVISNIEEGSRLTGPQLGAAEVKRTRLYHRMREFFGRFDFLVAPAVQVLPFDVQIPYPTSINGIELESYLDWMRSCHRIIGHRRAGHLRALRLQRRRTARGAADRGSPPAGVRAAATRSCIRAGDRMLEAAPGARLDWRRGAAVPQ